MPFNFVDYRGYWHGVVRISEYPTGWHIAAVCTMLSENYPEGKVIPFAKERSAWIHAMVMGALEQVLKNRTGSPIVEDSGLKLQFLPITYGICARVSQNNEPSVDVQLASVDAHLLLSYLRNEPPETRAFLYAPKDIKVH